MSNNTQSWLKDILILSILIGFMYTIFLGVRPLTPPDEGRYSEIPREMVVTGDYVTPHLNGIKYFEKPILFYWLQTLSIKAFGLQEWALRLVTALMGLLGAIITYWGARKLYNRDTGIIAALIVSSTILYAALAHFITLDMTITTFLTASLLCFLVGTRYPIGTTRRNLMWLMFATAALATLTKGLIGIIFPGIVIFSWTLLTKKWRQLGTYYLFSGSLIFLAITLPWHLLVQWKNPEFFDYYFLQQHFLRYLTNYADRHQPWWFFPLVLVGGFLPWTGFLYSAVQQQLRQLKYISSETIFLLLWAGIIFVFYWFSHSQLAPYILPIFPPLAIVTAHFISSDLFHPTKLGLGFWFSFLMIIFIPIGILCYVHINLPFPFMPIDLLAVLPILGIIGLVFYRSNKPTEALATLFLTMLFTTLFTNFCYDFVDQRSIKPLAVELNTLLKPRDIVYNFNHYYQDLPIYLNRNVKIVNWTGELTFGTQHQKTSLFLSESQLVTEWPTTVRKWLITKKDDLDYLKTNLNLRFYIVDIKKKYALICNQEVKK